MLEIVVGIGVCVLMGKAAAASGRSAAGWFALTFALCGASGLIPMPFLRFLMVGIVVFVLMTVTNKARV